VSDTVTIALVGICGYGGYYVNHILNGAEGRNVKCVAAVDPKPERCGRLAELKALGAQVYPDLETFYKNDTADLVVISTPTHLHCPLTCLALAQGSNVLCEKPVAATVQECLQMVEAEERARRFAAIGYQWSFSDAVQALKQDILAGELGRAIRMKTLVLWPRGMKYYGRNDWAGALKTEDGAWILDSPANNATAHYLHNMLYVLGDTSRTSARPVSVQAELYRANEIGNHDTAAIRCGTEAGAEVLFYTSHAVHSVVGPVACYEFEKGVVSFERDVGSNFVARFHDGRTRVYGNPDGEIAHKIWRSVEAVRTGKPVLCAARAAMSQTLCINGAQDSMPGIVVFPGDLIEMQGEGDTAVTCVKGLQAALVQCFAQGILPSEHGGIPWASEGKIVDLREYRFFPGGTCS